MTTNAYRISTTGYVPAHINLDADIITGEPWTWERLIAFFIGEANLVRRELYMGKCILISISRLLDLSKGIDSEDEPMITYKVTGSYLKGIKWEVQ